MAILDFFRRTRETPQASTLNSNLVVGATDEVDVNTISTFDNSAIAYAGDLASVSYDSLLRDPQKNIWDLMRLAAYYADADSVVHSIIYNCYLPYTTSCKWYLTCKNEKTIKLFEDYYKQIRLRQKLNQVAIDYWKYGQCYIYFYKGNIITLPVHKVKIGNVTLNGTPVIEINVQDIVNEFLERSYTIKEAPGVKDKIIEDILKAYPPQVAKAVKEGKQYAQLDPKNTFVCSAPVQGWQRYAVPWIASCLSALAKKELIHKWQVAQLNIGARPFVHATYGDKTRSLLPDINQLQQVRRIFSSAMSGASPLAVTNDLAEAKIVSLDVTDIFQWPLYQEVNSAILQAGGISAIISSGQSQDGSTFASAQVSIHTVCSRIESMQRQMEEMMNKLNRRVIEEIRLTHSNNTKEIPEFHFQPLSMNGKKELQETCKALWEKGLVSTKTYMESAGYSLTKEKAQRTAQSKDGTDSVLIPRDVIYNNKSQSSDGDSDNPVGRPALIDDERTSDPQNAIRSKQSKEANDSDFSDVEV